MKLGLWVSALFIPLMAANQGIDPLEGALWKGILTIHVDGKLFSQFLANRYTEDKRIPNGFIKEKGEMDLNFDLEIQFLINPLGEFTLWAKEDFRGKQHVDYEFRKMFDEEKLVKKTRVKILQKVQESTAVTTDVAFHREGVYNSESFDYGTFRLMPSGRMDRKGVIRVLGEFRIMFEGTGEQVDIRERQPLAQDEENTKTVSQITKKFELPLQLEFEIAHRRKTVEGTMSVAAPIDNPFPREDDQSGVKAIFTHQVNTVGTYRLEPLAGKK